MSDLTVPHNGLESLKALVLDSLSSSHSRRAYGTALDEFLTWYSVAPRGGFNKAAVQGWRMDLEQRGLAASSINIRLAAVRKLAGEAADNALLDPAIAAGIARVRGAARHGVRAGNWLTKAQAEDLLRSPDSSTLKGKRDRALLALLLGCGLRRNEAALLKFEDIQQREGRWIIVDLVGKHGRVRSVPMPAWAKAAVDDWGRAAGISTGRILRAINKGRRILREGMTPQSVFAVVTSLTSKLGVRVAPHDLRRTFAKLAHKGSARLEQIQLSLGHASIVTTERYLGVRQDLHDAPCDRLGLTVY